MSDLPLPIPPKMNSKVNIENGDAAFRVVEASVLGLWEVVNNLTLIQPPKRERYRVTIFGSARMEPGNPLYEDDLVI
ncbi:MAG: hypothetical protein AAGF01_02045 [Cyanobacteria bacterium P01_G01_bin.38]